MARPKRDYKNWTEREFTLFKKRMYAQGERNGIRKERKRIATTSQVEVHPSVHERAKLSNEFIEETIKEITTFLNDDSINIPAKYADKMARKMLDYTNGRELLESLEHGIDGSLTVRGNMLSIDILRNDLYQLMRKTFWGSIKSKFF